jgi:hypothetical protein
MTLKRRHPPRRLTGNGDQPIPPRKLRGGRINRGTDDPAEAVERIVSRRRLLIEAGDVFISRAIATVRGSAHRDLYVLSRQDMGPLPGRFTSFEHAVVAGDELAAKLRVRLYFLESPDHPPHLLKDCRR